MKVSVSVKIKLGDIFRHGLLFFGGKCAIIQIVNPYRVAGGMHG